MCRDPLAADTGTTVLQLRETWRAVVNRGVAKNGPGSLLDQPVQRIVEEQTRKGPVAGNRR